MHSNTKQKIYSLKKICTPQHPLINTIWMAFENIRFSIPITDWIDHALLPQPYLSDIKIWHPTPQGTPELLAGFRSFNIAKAVDLNEITATEYLGISEAEALEISIIDILYPLLIWSHGNKSSNVQAYNFCKYIQKNLPSTYRKQLPRQTEIRHLLKISDHVGKKQPPTQSKLTRLRKNISIAIENTEPVPAHDNQD